MPGGGFPPNPLSSQTPGSSRCWRATGTLLAGGQKGKGAPACFFGVLRVRFSATPEMKAGSSRGSLAMPFRRGNSRVTADYSPGRGTRLRLVTGCVKASGEQLQGSLTPRRSILWASFFFLNGFKFFVFPSLCTSCLARAAPPPPGPTGRTGPPWATSPLPGASPKPQSPGCQLRNTSLARGEREKRQPFRRREGPTSSRRCD